MLKAILPQLNRGARVPLVGLISQYNAAEPPPGPDLMPLLVKRALIQGFIVSDHPDRQADFLRDVSGWLKEGKIKYREHVVEGLENAPRAFLGPVQGRELRQADRAGGRGPDEGGVAAVVGGSSFQCPRPREREGPRPKGREVHSPTESGSCPAIRR